MRCEENPMTMSKGRGLGKGGSWGREGGGGVLLMG